MGAGSVTGYVAVQRSVHSDRLASQTTIAYISILVQMSLRSHVGAILFYPYYIELLGVLMLERCHVATVTITDKVVSFGP